MLTDYIQTAMHNSHYELIEDGTFFATIPGLEGLWANAATLEECRDKLQSSLEDWLLLGLKLGHQMPVVDGIDLNLDLTPLEVA
jgi:predicted RNase H-like HicB family nuclease